jgi:DNA helicase IV
MLLGIYKKSRVRFDRMRNKYADAYKENVKPVIGIDEATDYSVIDYYFMASFRHYEYSTITLCGDIMQGLNDNGIKDWNQLKDFVLPNLMVCELKTSYRQLPSLLDMSKQMYFDDRKVEAPYETKKKHSDDEPAPICFISDDEDEKAEWIAKRIIEVYKTYEQSMPSVAIFVGDDVNIKELVDLINDQDYLNGIQIYDCSENRTATNTKAVRVFRISEVKGMEFEVVFFYDIDKALKDCSLDIMRRYLYVGVSRATTHLAATFTQEEGNKDIIKYFDKMVDNWKI